MIETKLIIAFSTILLGLITTKREIKAIMDVAFERKYIDLGDLSREMVKKGCV